MASLSSVESRIKRYDKALSLRDPGGECPFIYLYRREQDGRNNKIGEIKKELIGDGSYLMAVLKRNDIWASGGGKKFADEMDDEEITRRTIYKRKRKENFIDQAREERDVLHRMNGRRVNNAGVPS